MIHPTAKVTELTKKNLPARNTLVQLLALYARLVVLESGLGLESGLESIFAGLGLGLDLKGLGLETLGLGLVLGLGSFFLQVLFQVHL